MIILWGVVKNGENRYVIIDNPLTSRKNLLKPIFFLNSILKKYGTMS